MVNTGNALYLAFKLHAGRIGAGGSFQVFCGSQLCKHLTFDAPLFTACCYPSRFITTAIWIALHPDVLLLYDPAKGTQNGDSAGCVVVAPPAVPGGKFRILERHQWRGMDFRAQADAIKKLTEQYNVTYIGIDSTGVGHGVYENVKAFFPAVREFVYNPNVKNALVLKAYDIISHRRLEFDAGHTDIAQSFMAIRRATTASGNRPTYEASRSEEASHADLAWATMHALFNEPLQGESANTSNIVEIF